MVGAADHRGAGDVLETHLPRARAVFSELLRRHELHHRQMLERRLQILAESEQVAADPAQISKGGKQLLLGLAQAQHETGLGVNLPVALRLHRRSEEHTSELQSRQYLVCR